MTADLSTGAGGVLPAAQFRVSPFWRLLPAGMRRRWWLFRAIDWIARHWPVAGPKRGALVVRMDGIGDMVLFRSALDRYAEALGLPREEIVVLGCASWREIAGDAFAGYRVEILDEHRYARRPLYRFCVSLKVRRLNARIALLDSYFRRALMADSLVYVSAARETVVSLPYISERTRPEYRWFLSLAGTVIDTGPYPTHEIVRHFRFLSALAGREIAPVPPRLAWRDGTPAPGAKPFALLNPGANEPGRRWPLASYAALGRRLLGRGLDVVVVGHTGALEADESFGRLLAEPGVRDLRGRTSLSALMDLMRGAALVVSNDSGPAHLAVALGAPTIVLVGGGHFGCFVPYPDVLSPAHARFLWEPMDCFHCFWRCHKRTGARDPFPCVAAIPEERAWTSAQELLAQAGSRS